MFKLTFISCVIAILIIDNISKYVALCLALVISIMVLLAWRNTSFGSLSKKKGIGCFLICLMCLIVCLRAHMQKSAERNLSKNLKETVSINAKACVVKTRINFIEAKIVEGPFSGARIYVSQRKLTLHYLDKIRLEGSVKSKGEQTWVYPSQISLEEKSPLLWLFKYKEGIIVFTRTYLPAAYANLLVSLVIGVSDIEVDKSVQTLFRDLGLVHILVVSGAQVAILTGFLNMLFKFVMMPRFITFCLVTIINILFLLMTGGDLSITRAVLMSVIAQYIIFDRRDKQGSEIFWLTGLLMILYQPNYIYSLSFILSFLATFALLEIQPKICEFLKKVTFLPRWFSETLAPVLVTSPVIMVVFKRWDWLALVANILLLPIVEWVVVLGFVYMVFINLVPFIATLILEIIFGLMVVIMSGAKIVASVPSHTSYFQNVLVINIVSYYILLIILIYYSFLLRKYKYELLVALSTVLFINHYLLFTKEDVLFLYGKQNFNYVLLSSNNKYIILTDDKKQMFLQQFMQQNNYQRLPVYYLGANEYRLNLEKNNKVSVLINEKQLSLDNGKIVLHYLLNEHYLYVNDLKCNFAQNILYSATEKQSIKIVFRHNEMYVSRMF